MQRILNWDVALVEYVTNLQGQPFTWGTTDCASIMRGCMTAMYGADPWAGQFMYSTLREATEMLESTGGVSAQLLALNAVEVAPGFIQQGDIIIGEPLDDDFADNVFVMVAGHLVSATIAEGVVFRSLAELPLNAQILRLPYGW